MNLRLAEFKDIDQLIKMRWDSTIEDDESKKDESFSDFEKECRVFWESHIPLCIHDKCLYSSGIQE